MKGKKHVLLGVALLSLMLSACSGGNNDSSSEEPVIDSYFTYEDISFTDTIGTKTNDESYDYDSLKVNRLSHDLRDDFAFGVDASMTKVVLDNNGVYYNQSGQEQEFFQILRRSGVNFVRFRLWNNPQNRLRMSYGGGGNNLATDLALARKAKAANLNVMIDFHYSDFWADPDRQNVPLAWGDLTQSQIPAQIQTYTTETLQAFKDAGITVDAVQIGNEINNGLCGYKINWNDTATSFNVMAEMLKAGIAGAKAVFPDTRTIIHLANGGNAEEFRNFFTAMKDRSVGYDIIGASYYPHLSGSLSELQTNLNNVTELTGKPAMIVETSWGFTNDTYYDPESGEQLTMNSYSNADEDAGGYLTGVQAQATVIRDVAEVLASVPNNKGLGMFWWEPGWLPVVNAAGKCASPWATAAGQSYQYYGNDTKRSSYEDGLATWSNQGLFSYTGKALPSLKTYSYLKEGFNEVRETATRARSETLNVTINIAASETLPATAKVETNLDAIRDANCVWSTEAVEAVKVKGDHNDLSGVLNGQYNIKANAHCIQNYIVDPGFENQGTTDDVKEPWVVESVTPAGEKVVKLDRKKDIRSGKTDLNWYHSTSDYTFNVSQTVSNLPAGTYTLTTYIMGSEFSKLPHTALKLYVKDANGADVVEAHDLCNAEFLKGWSAGYQTCTLNFTISSAQNIKVGLEGAAKVGAWCHNDDWELVAHD